MSTLEPGRTYSIACRLPFRSFVSPRDAARDAPNHIEPSARHSDLWPSEMGVFKVVSCIHLSSRGGQPSRMQPHESLDVYEEALF